MKLLWTSPRVGARIPPNLEKYLSVMVIWRRIMVHKVELWLRQLAPCGWAGKVDRKAVPFGEFCQETF